MSIDFRKIEEIIREAGKILLDAKITSDSVYQKEGAANFVTKYDMLIQSFLIERFAVLCPEASFYGEEDTEGSEQEINSKPYVFFIDPIDGTTNFLFGYKHSCISVGLMYQKKMLAGYVYNPYTDDMYTAVKGQGAFLNGNLLDIKNQGIGEGIVSFGCARYNEEHVDLLFKVVKTLFMKSLSVREGGSAALDLCRIAAGANVSYLELKLQPYDYAAASVIIEEAGGVIMQIDGLPITFDRPCSIVGGSPRAVEEVRKIIRDCSEE